MPLTDDQVIEAFGDPRPYIRPDGSVDPSWESRELVMFALPAPLELTSGLGVATHVRCHWRVSALLQAALTKIYLDPQLWNSLEDFDGCYCWRRMRGEISLSRHAWGIAVDINALRNPFGAPPYQLPGVVEAFASQGFEWGGSWHGPRVDGMHFEFSDLARLAPVDSSQAPA